MTDYYRVRATMLTGSETGSMIRKCDFGLFLTSEAAEQCMIALAGRAGITGGDIEHVSHSNAMLSRERPRKGER
uniref:Uncharacterized protein n=1 Tax=viral metagenome TaxID=1070528 RepID=A0A6M3JGX3_9ZZZZ